MELRMYGMVPYNISPIQQGIQFGHAVVRYGRTVKGIKPFEDAFNEWADKHETFIILNGGTTNLNPDKLGSLNQHLATFRENGIHVQDFYEPDLGDQLTAFCFLVDERVFNKELYPDFEPLKGFPDTDPIWLEEKNKMEYYKWVESIGGKENAFLREYLRSIKKA